MVRTPAVLYLFTNGMVMAFDSSGEQMPEYQGYYGQHVNDIIDAVGDDFTWTLAQWHSGGIEELATFKAVRV